MIAIHLKIDGFGGNLDGACLVHNERNILPCIKQIDNVIYLHFCSIFPQTISSFLLECDEEVLCVYGTIFYCRVQFTYQCQYFIAGSS